MKPTLKRLAVIGLSSALFVLPAQIARADYVQIGPGPSLEYAKAYCDNASMGVGNGYFAYGSQSYVIGAAIGNALGNAIMQARFFSNCMAMHGWKKMRGGSKNAQAKVRTNFNSTMSRKCREAQSISDLQSKC